MMGADRFMANCAQLPELLDELLACPPYPMQAMKDWGGVKAVYAFFESGEARHVGRTRNLRQRIGGHTTNSHFSASFAFAESRRKLGIPVTYRKGEGRAALMEREDFRREFDWQQKRIRQMTVKFVRVDDPITQHLFELYAALQLDTPLDGFETS